MNIVYATTNPGKFNEAKRNFEEYGIKIVSPLELNLKIDVEETGNTLIENAIIKAEAYLPFVPANTIIVSDDTGLEIDALGGEPGIKVRRWKGYKMTDEEIIEYCIERMKHVPEGHRTAHFKIAIAVAYKGVTTQTFVGSYKTSILLDPLPFREEGFPFRPLITSEKPTHRSSAIKAALPYLTALAGLSTLLR